MKFLRSILDSIDNEADYELKKAGGVKAYRFKIWIILITVSFSLLIVHYIKFNYVFISFIKLLSIWLSFDASILLNSKFFQLYGYIWWTSWHIVLFLLVPIFTIKVIFKESLGSYGWQKGVLFKHWKVYISAIVFLIIFLSWFSFNNSSFASYYPFYKQAYRSWVDLIVWEFLYIFQFIALEFFFRGYIVHGLKVPFGSSSIAVMVVPYMMLHLPKLWPEATGAIFFGIFLGFLALKSRSIWGGVAIHTSVALTLDISALLQSHGLPNTLFP